MTPDEALESVDWLRSSKCRFFLHDAYGIVDRRKIAIEINLLDDSARNLHVKLLLGARNSFRSFAEIMKRVHNDGNAVFHADTCRSELSFCAGLREYMR